MVVNKIILVVAKPGSKSNKDGLWCNYCKKPRHTKEACFKLHGKKQLLHRLGGFKGIPNGQANLTNQDRTPPERISSSGIDLKKEIE